MTKATFFILKVYQKAFIILSNFLFCAIVNFFAKENKIQSHNEWKKVLKIKHLNTMTHYLWNEEDEQMQSDKTLNGKISPFVMKRPLANAR